MSNLQRCAFISTFLFLLIGLLSCKQEYQGKQFPKLQEKPIVQLNDTLIVISQPNHEPKQLDYNVNEWEELTPSQGIILDLKYASNDNFTKQIIYPCARCFLRPAFAEKLLQGQQILEDSLGYKFKLFDCYRPRPAQQRLWDIYPDLNYVSPPSKGSMHNRGLAVDLTIVDKAGVDLDMGTAFDFFGPASHSAYVDLPKQVLENRKLLRSIMNRVGLSGIRTEWWHFSLKPVQYQLSDWEWECP